MSLTPEQIYQKIQLLRLEFGDTDEEYMILQDSEYQLLITTYQDLSPRAFENKVLFAFLSKLALNSVRERVGQEERYGHGAFENYMNMLKKKLKDPSFGAIAPIAYFGGTYRDVSEYYMNCPDYTWQPFYRGSETGQPSWRGHRVYKVNGQIIEPYECSGKFPTLDGDDFGICQSP